MPIPEGNYPLDKKSTKEKVYQIIREWIVKGTLTPNEQIYDSKLAEYFYSSRTPIREAILLLESEGLVVIKPGKSTIVSDLDVHKIREWYVPLASLQGLAAELACGAATDRQIAELKKCGDHFVKAVESGDVMAIIDRDFDFHMKIASLTGNKYLVNFCRILLGHISRIEFAYFSAPDRGKASIGGHGELIDLISKSDGPAANARLKESWLKTMRQCERELSKNTALK